MRRLIILIVCFFWLSPAWAALDLVLTQGVAGALPIAIVPFAGQPSDSTDIANIVQSDLRNSGRFSVLDNLPSLPHQASEVTAGIWHKASVDSVVVGKVQALDNGNYRITFNLVDVYKANASSLINQEFTVNKADFRRLAHHISDIVFQQLTGIKGIFSTRIAYIKVKHGEGNTSEYVLEVADADGFSPRAIVTSPEPIMSPAWSHDGKKLAYVSFENRRAQIFISTLATGERRLVSSFPGINGAPAWSPDGTKLALVLSKSGNPNIYILDLNGNRLQSITNDRAINTEPSWAPDGQSLVFTSDRGGSPQIYQVRLADRHVERLTFDGNYNAHASYSPDGQHLVMLHRSEGKFVVATQDLQNGSLQVLTSSGRDESPSLSANGTMVLYGSEFGKLGMVSSDGRVKLNLPARDGDVKEPVWSPYLNS